MAVLSSGPAETGTPRPDDPAAAIARLLSTAKAEQSREHGSAALDALDELLKIDPEHEEAKALRKKVVSAYSSWWVSRVKAECEGIKKEQYRSSIYWQLAEAQAGRKDIKGAKLSAKQIANPGFRGQALKTIAFVQAHNGNYHGAKQTVQKHIQADALKWSAYESIAQVEALSGKMAAARATLEQIPPGPRRASAVVAVAVTQAGVGDTKGARAALGSIRGASGKAEVLCAIVYAKLREKDFAGAEAAASEIQDPREQPNAYGLIARAHAEANEMGSFQKAIESAKASASRIQDERWRDACRQSIAWLQAESGDIEGARATARLIEERFWKSQTYLGIAKALAKGNDRRGARESVDLAVSEAQAIPEAGSRQSALQPIAIELARTDLNCPARAVALTGVIPAPFSKAVTYLAIAEARLDAKDQEGLREAFRLAKSTAANISEGFMLSTLAMQAARLLMKAGDTKAAIEEGRRLAEASGRAGVYRLVANRLARNGEYSYLERWLDELKEPFERANVCLGAVDGLTKPSVRTRTLMEELIE